MSQRRRLGFGAGLLVGLVLAVGLVVWWTQGPSQSSVRRTVLTTIQEESPASFLVTGTLRMSTTVRIDSTQYLTPEWVTFVLAQTQPSLLPFLEGSSEAQIRVPGRVSYGFEVDELRAEMITIEENDVVVVDLPELSIHSIEPELANLQVRTRQKGWMRVFPSEVSQNVRSRALGEVRATFRAQAESRLQAATQPRVNTARALKKMLTPPLRASGLDRPRFRIRVGDQLTLDTGDAS
jgi:hypothetical protein